MKTLLIWISILTFAGILLSLYLIPNQEDQALIELKTHKYSKAVDYFQYQYDQGNHTPDVLIALAKLNFQKGDLNRSILMLEEYLSSYPNDLKALRFIADLYKQNQQYPEYYRTLKHMDTLKEDPTVMQELLEGYQNAELKEPTFEMTKRYIATGKADESYYVSLAMLYAEKKDFREAYQLLEARKKKFPKQVKLNDLLFELWILSQAGKGYKSDELLELEVLQSISTYLLEKRDPELSNYTIGVFKRNNPELLPILIKELQPQIEQSPSLQILTFQMDWENPRLRKKEIPRLFRLLNEYPENKSLQNLAFDVYLEQGNDELINQFIHKIDFRNIEERRLFNLAVYALQHQNPELAEEMQRDLGKDFLEKRPVLNMALAIAVAPEVFKDRLSVFIKNNSLTQQQKFFLLKIASAAKFHDATLELGEMLEPYQSLEDYELIEIALAYISVKEAKVLAQLLEKNHSKLNLRKKNLLKAILEIPLGNPLWVLEWLQMQKKVPENVYSSLLTVAQENKQYPLALYIAKRFNQEYPSYMNQANYGLALIQIGKVQEGMHLIDQSYQDHQQDRQLDKLYLNALMAAAKQDASYKAQLAQWMNRFEAEEKMTEQMWQDFAFVYLEVLNDYSRAEKAFWHVSKKDNPKSVFTQTLVYLWGPRPSQIQIDWLTFRARQSNSSNFGYWLEFLNFVQQPKIVVELFQERCNEDFKVRAYFAYMDALAYLKERELLRNTIDRVLGSLKSKKNLIRLSNLAEEAEYTDARRWIWETIVSQWPDDPHNWQNLAKATYDQHDYSRTSFALYHFFSRIGFDNTGTCDLLAHHYSKKYPKFYESLYQLAEVIRRKAFLSELFRQQGFYLESDFYYQLAILEIAKFNNKTPRMKEIKALAFQRLYQERKATDHLKELVNSSAWDPELAATYANMLMDVGELKEARNFLQKTTQNPIQRRCNFFNPLGLLKP